MCPNDNFGRPMTIPQSYRCWMFALEPLPKERLMRELKIKTQQQDWLDISSIEVVNSTELSFYGAAFKFTLAVSGSEQSPDLRSLLESVSETLELDYCVLDEHSSAKPIRLAVFDMDSTLIPMEVIDELADVAGVKTEVAEITESAMQGKLDFDQSFKQRLALLKGMPEDAVNEVRARLQLNPGVSDFIEFLVKQGAVVAVASGGFVPFAESLASKVPIMRLRANQLQFVDGGLTGSAVEPIINASIKAEQLAQWRDELGLMNEEVLAVGDGANDQLMLNASGLGVAYKAKPILRKNADCVIRYGEMDGLVDVLRLIASMEE
ncbi:phosphoserine phosphatase SerB [Kangiella sp. HD9-110m-PIT-SAG07]|nr:phosphoserine phosphatase SerB [Kangiella sp. HD9-110m-PIT-SAG07]